MEDSKTLLMLSSSKVLPDSAAHTIQNKVFELSPFDLTKTYTSYQKRVLFFKNSPPWSSSVLRESLSKALVFFYPFAGSLSLIKDKLHLSCDNTGVTFLEASTTATVDDLAKDSFMPSKFVDRLCQMEVEPTWPWSSNNSLLTIQVTSFKCGGMSIGASYSHQICDGPSFWHFMNSWSEIARVGAPLFLPQVSYNIPVQTTDKNEIEGFKLLPRSIAADIATGADVPLRLIRFKPEQLSALATAAPGFNAYKLVCGYIWKKLSEAWDKPDDETTSLYVFANCRCKHRGLSRHYFGNALMGTIATSTVGEIRSNPLSFAADLIYDAVIDLSNEKIERVVGWMYESVDQPGYFPTCEWKAGSNVVIVDSPLQPIYGIDFGWGVPAAKSFGTNDLAENQIYLAPSSPETGGGIDMIVATSSYLDF